MGMEGELSLSDISNLHCLPTQVVDDARNKGPPAALRYHSSSVIETTIFIIGGWHSNNKYCNEVFMLEIKKGSLAWSQPKVRGDVLPSLAYHTAVTLQKRIFLFGGKNESQLLNDVFIFNTSTLSWSCCSSSSSSSSNRPSARYSHSATSLSERTFVVFGGTAATGTAYNDLHIFDVDSLSWRKQDTSGPSPSPRYGHAAAMAESKLFIVGGRNGNTIFNDVHILDTKVWKWSQVLTVENPPPPLYSHGMAILSNFIVITGGKSHEGLEKGVHVFDTKASVWRPSLTKLEGLRACAGHASAVYGNNIYLLGGEEEHVQDFKINVLSIEDVTTVMPVRRQLHKNRTFNTLHAHASLRRPASIPELSRVSSRYSASHANSKLRTYLTHLRTHVEEKLGENCDSEFRKEYHKLEKKIKRLFEKQLAASDDVSMPPEYSSVRSPKQSSRTAARRLPDGWMNSASASDSDAASSPERRPSLQVASPKNSKSADENEKEGEKREEKKFVGVMRSISRASSLTSPPLISNNNNNTNTVKFDDQKATDAKINGSKIIDVKIEDKKAESAKTGGSKIIDVKIEDKKVESAKTGDSSVETGDNKVDNAKTGENKVDIAKPADNKVSDVKTGDNKVSDVKTGDNKVGDAKIGDSKVSDVKIGDHKTFDVKLGDILKVTSPRLEPIARSLDSATTPALKRSSLIIYRKSEGPSSPPDFSKFDSSTNTPPPAGPVFLSPETSKRVQFLQPRSSAPPSQLLLDPNKAVGEDAPSRKSFVKVRTRTRSRSVDAEKALSIAESVANMPAEHNNNNNNGNSTDKPEATVNEDERQQVIKEICEGELQYLIDLRIVLRLFMEPLDGILTPTEIVAVFCNLAQIVGVSEELVKKLENTRYSPSEDQKIGEVFVNMIPYMKVFLVYCSNHGVAKTTVTKLKQTNEAFKLFLDNAIKNPHCRLLEFEDFLIKPMQRVMRYPLLIQRLLKCTPPRHNDYFSLVRAHQQLQQLVLDANERKRAMEGATRISEIQAKMMWAGEKIDLLVPGRDLIHEIVLPAKVTKQLAGKITLNVTSTLRFILFSDMLLVVKEKKAVKNVEKYVEKCRISLQECHMWDANGVDLVLKGADKKEGVFGFIIIVRDANFRVVVATQNVGEKENTMQLLNRCIGQRGVAVLKQTREREMLRRSKSTGDMMKHLKILHELHSADADIDE